MRLNTARPSNLSFWRDRSSHEVDLLIEKGGELLPIEVKSGATVSRDAIGGLKKWQAISGQMEPRPRLIYGGDETQHRSEVDIIPWYRLASSQKSGVSPRSASIHIRRGETPLPQ